MKIICANAEYLNPADKHPYQFMEMVGRTCYKSEDKITEDSTIRFIKNLVKNCHTAMLEHAHIILKLDNEAMNPFITALSVVQCSPETTATYAPYVNYSACGDVNYVSASFRTFINMFRDKPTEVNIKYTKIQNLLHQHYPDIFPKVKIDENESGEIELLSREEFIKDVQKSQPIELVNCTLRKHLTHTIRFICDRGVSHEFVRHRPASFAQESTRYCNYSNDKFDNEITVIEPRFWNDEYVDKESEEMAEIAYDIWKKSCENSESVYFKLLQCGATPQEARTVLPNSLKTELIITATENEWQHIINLRLHGTTGKPHPQMFEVMEIAHSMLLTFSDERIL